MKPENYEIKCACGCEQTLLKYSKWGEPRNFINGHNARLQISPRGFLGKKHTPEARKKMSEALTKAYENKPELREMRSKKFKNRVFSNESKQKISDTLKEYYINHPETKLKISKQAKTRKGGKNPFFGRKHSLETKKLIGEKNKGKLVGEKNPQWKGGSPYPEEFNRIKSIIRERDDFSCCLCQKTKNDNENKLPIHHIDDNKKNNDPLNLITLCIPCHHKTYINKEYWKKVLSNYVNQEYGETH